MNTFLTKHGTRNIKRFPKKDFPYYNHTEKVTFSMQKERTNCTQTETTL